MAKSIKFKLIAFLSFLLILTIIVCLLGTKRVVESFQSQSDRTRVNNLQKIINASFETRQNALTEQSELVGILPILSTVVENGDVPTIEDTARFYQEKLAVPIFEILDMDGEALASLSTKECPGLLEALSDGIEGVFEEGETYSSRVIVNGQILFIVISVIGLAEEPSGFLITGYPFDSPLMSSIKELSGLDVSIVADQKIQASSLSLEEQQQLEGHLSQTEEVWIEVGEALITHKPILDIDEKALGTLFFQASLAESKAVLEELRNTMMMIGSGIFVIAIFLGLILTMRVLITPLKSFFTILSAMSEGTFQQYPELRSQDELGMMSRWLNRVSHNLKEMIQEVFFQAQQQQDASQELKQTAQEMLSGMQSVKSNTQSITNISKSAADHAVSAAKSTSQAASEIESVGTGVQELNQSIISVDQVFKQVSGNMVNTNQRISEIPDNISNISKLLNNLSDSFTKINTDTKQATDVSLQANESTQTFLELMRQLQEDISNIGSMVNLIENIAEQTNMLALNATIEAASAGEAGKGFAVVASEVKALAEQTSQANHKIVEQIETIQEQMSQALNHSYQVDEVIVQLRDINGGINEIITEQNRSIAEVNESANVIFQSSKDSAASVQGAVEELKSASNIIGEVVEVTQNTTMQVTQNVQEVQVIAENINAVSSQIQTVYQQINDVQSSLNEFESGIADNQEKAESLNQISNDVITLMSKFDV